MMSRWPQEIEQIRIALANRGYRSELRPPPPQGRLPAGSTVAIQFGDRVAVGPKGRPQFVIHGAFQINADSGLAPGFVRLAIAKTNSMPADRSLELALKIDLQLAIEADFCPPGELADGVSAIQSAHAYRHLQGLVDDAHHTLRDLPIDHHRKEISGPAMRIEARWVGDLASGRSGVVRPCEPAVSRDFVRLSLAACNWMQARILPELRLVMRDLTGPGTPIAGVAPPREQAFEYDTRRLPHHESAELVPEHETIQ